MNGDLWYIIGIVALLVLIAFGFLISNWVLDKLATRYVERAARDLGADLGRNLRRLLDATPSPVHPKKQYFQRTDLRTFYYLDEYQVRSLYSQIVQGLEPRQIETRTTTQKKKGLKGRLGLLEPHYEKGEAREEARLYDATPTPTTMYKRIEKHMIDEDEITFGLEMFEYEDSWIAEFRSHCEALGRFGLPIEERIQENVISDKMSEFARENVERLSNSSGFVAIQEEFVVAESSEKTITLGFVHPATNRLDHVVTIEIVCDKDSLTSSGQVAFRQGSYIKIACVGKVTRWDKDEHVLELNPMAIY